uniref:Uncharacterized protein n=1 Tax=Solanum tuberosum TaxID=4113 RepID=M0ZQI3_SOLTU
MYIAVYILYTTPFRTFQDLFQLPTSRNDEFNSTRSKIGPPWPNSICKEGGREFSELNRNRNDSIKKKHK